MKKTKQNESIWRKKIIMLKIRKIIKEISSAAVNDICEDLMMTSKWPNNKQIGPRAQCLLAVKNVLIRLNQCTTHCPPRKKNTVIKNQAYICVLKKVQEISHVHISISIAWKTNKQTHFSHSIIIHLKGTRQN